MRYFIKAMRIMGFVSDWAAQALEDNTVTAVEAARLVEGICELLGVKSEVDFSKL